MTEGGMICVVLPGWNLPAGYTVGSSDLLLRLNPAYPDVCPDMWWFSAAVVRADATPIPATESQETYLGRSWQRWSTPGIDDATFLWVTDDPTLTVRSPPVGQETG